MYTILKRTKHVVYNVLSFCFEIILCEFAQLDVFADGDMFAVEE